VKQPGGSPDKGELVPEDSTHTSSTKDVVSVNRDGEAASGVEEWRARWLRICMIAL
jgi:hypothetical protein